MHRFAVAAIAIAALGSSASANVEVGGTAGAHVFSDKSALGFVAGPNETTQSNTVLFGVRLGYYFSEQLGIEVEGGLIPAEPRKMIFDVYNITGRGGVVYQFRADKADNVLVPFLYGGVGIVDLVKSNNTDVLKLDTQPFVSVGGGAKYKTAGGWGVRFDLRFNIGKANAASSGIAPDIEALASLYKEFGRKEAPIAPKKTDEPKGKSEPDTDNDGIPDSKDKCPKEAEDKDGFQDEDGCPDLDNDGDGIPDAKDKCPDKAEDKDGFQDDDGCPDPDNDNDGIPDAADKCPDQPETMNGYQDDDGCPDEIPAKLKAFTGAIAGINFKPSSADLAAGSNGTLDKAVAVLVEFKDIKLEIGGHTDDQPLTDKKKFADNEALSQARAESVKAYMVKKGVEEGRLTAKGYGDKVPVEDPAGLKGGKLNAARAKNRRVEFKIVQAPAAAADATPPAADKPATP